MKNILLLFLIILLILGCEISKQHNVTYEKKSIIDEKFFVDDSSNYVEIKLEAFKVVDPTDPVLANEINHDVALFLNSHIHKEGQFESPEQLKDSLIADYKSVRNENPDFTFNYLLERIAEVKTDTLNLFSFSKNEMTYFGGAHPNSSRIYSNYDVTNSSLISLDSLFVENYSEKLKEVAETHFRKMKNLSLDENLEAAGYWFDNGEFSLNENFLITNEGLLFYYNPYEIAAYAVGSTELLIPYSEIRDIVKEDGPLEDFINP